jgi:peptidoglycan hydrolase-like protein with peptidoglycan-binding domain
VDYARDLGEVDLWEESLKRSLERRGRPRRSSVELYRLRPERNLVTGEELERSASYSELRRRAARGTTMPSAGVAVSGISALTLLAGATLPSLLSGARAARKERIAYASDTHARAKAEAAVRGTYAGAGNAKASAAQLDLATEPSIVRAQTEHQLNAGAASVASHRAASTGAAAHASTPATATAAASVPAAAATRPAASTVGAPHSAAVATSPTIVHGTLLREATGTSGGAGLALRHTSRTGGVSAPHGLPPTVAAVRELQQRLHLDPVDGSFGPVTEQAVKSFQQAHGLAATGVVSASTWKALGLAPRVTLQPDAALMPAPVLTQPVTTTERAAAPGQAVHTTGGVATPTVATRTTTTAPTQSGPGTYVQTRLNDMVAAGNRIATRPYVYGGGHGSFNSYGYDCSGSVSYVLHAAGLLSAPEDSTELESYGAAGAGRYVTIYANSGHAWMTIQGRRFDTVALAETGSRWSRTMASTSGYVVRHPKGF